MDLVGSPLGADRHGDGGPRLGLSVAKDLDLQPGRWPAKQQEQGLITAAVTLDEQLAGHEGQSLCVGFPG